MDFEEALQILGLGVSKLSDFCSFKLDIQKNWKKLFIRYQGKNDKELSRVNRAYDLLKSISNDEFDEILVDENLEKDIFIEDNNEDFSKDNHLINAIKFIEKEDYDNAIIETSSGIKFDDKNAVLYKLRAISRLDSETIYKNDQIFKDINKALELNPTDAESYFTKARIIFDIVSKTTELKFFTDKDLKNLNEAKKYLDIAIKLELDDIFSLILRGRIKLHSGDIEGGRQDIYKAYELCPNEDEFSDLILEVANCTFRKYFGYEYLELLNESISEIQKRNLLKIKKDLNFAIKLDKNNISAYFIRGVVNKLLNNEEGSSKDFKIVKNKDTEDDFGYAETIKAIKNRNNIFWKFHQWMIEE